MAKKPKVTLPPITWDANDHTLVWQLILEITKPQNLKVLCGKSKHKNTSGKMKASIFWHIGSVLLPELYSMDAAATRDQIKHKYEGLVKLYKQHAKRLAITGEGIGTDAKDGMDAETYDIISQFPFFPDLHCIWAMKPNKNPIAVTTGVGPSRKRALIMQPLAANDETAECDDDLGFTLCFGCISHVHSRSNTDAINAHIQEELIIKKCQLLLEEFRAGVWDLEEYQEELRKLESGEHPGK
ncbi:hypothetical protein F5J12DRAFT_720752 [Pisolithus orientalis]|uniref:uncharacterized protein n=1 Tax=Pisolithus orientalis TaxID=936130 RepID=UPI00222441A5|nr:uncharacterized protein F5J12DRAFT_720752 [Pisolithus orientalis]KAI6006652.1 hypothetical protein F5J12DRAFT_720752 [Pisolithus orientalis]